MSLQAAAHTDFPCTIIFIVITFLSNICAVNGCGADGDAGVGSFACNRNTENDDNHLLLPATGSIWKLKGTEVMYRLVSSHCKDNVACKCSK